MNEADGTNQLKKDQDLRTKKEKYINYGEII